MNTLAAAVILYAVFFFTSFVTVCYFLNILQHADWQVSQYFRILSRESLCWLPIVFAIVPAAALILNYRLPGIILLIIYETVVCLYYAPWPKRQKLEKSKRTGHLLVQWMILSAAVVIIMACLPGRSAAAAAVIGCLFYLSVPFLAPLVYKSGLPIERKAGGRYVHISRRLMSFHPGLRIIAVTGSDDSPVCGKALQSVLSSKYNCELASDVVKTEVDAARVIREIEDPTAEILICRIDAADRKEMEAIVRTLHPEIVVQTAADFWSVSEGAAPVGEHGLCFINGDDEVLRQIIRKDRVLTFGLDERNDCHGRRIRTGKEGTTVGVSLTVDREKEFRFTTPLLGKKNIISLVGAISVAYTLGISDDEMSGPIGRITGQRHRMELLPHDTGTIWIDDSANKDPEEAEEALDTLNEFEGTKILITDGFARLGAIQETANRNYGARAAEVCDQVILVGTEPVYGLKQGILDTGFMPEHLLEVRSGEEAMEIIRKLPDDADAVVLMEYAGSGDPNTFRIH